MESKDGPWPCDEHEKLKDAVIEAARELESSMNEALAPGEKKVNRADRTGRTTLKLFDAVQLDLEITCGDFEDDDSDEIDIEEVEDTHD